MRKPIWLVAGALIVVSAVVLFFSWRASHVTPPAKAPIAATTPPANGSSIQNPLPESGSGPAALPNLDGSDGPLGDSLENLIGKSAFTGLFRPEMLVRHIVVTVDNLSRKRVAVELRPTKAVPGKFAVIGDDQMSTLDPANYQRYTPYVQVIQMLDTKQLAALYVHYYPLFQQAYANLGYPNGYFNDRLVDTIDNLLSTPDITTDIELVRPNVMYQFADPKLEDLSAGQKALLRMGPTNAELVKAKLRDLRAQIADRSRDSDRSRGGSNAREGAGPN